MYIKRIPQGVQAALSSAIWRLDSDVPHLYLSFDDGPRAHSAELLDLLKAFDAQASFFLLGEQVEQFPDILNRLREEGHAIGNHGYQHLDGWHTSTKRYLANMKRGKVLLNTELYRPPYGRMTPAQWRAISASEQIIMWDLMPGDFDPKVDGKQCAKQVIDNMKAGSIVVLHDNLQSWPTLSQALPIILDAAQKKGLLMKPLSF